MIEWGLILETFIKWAVPVAAAAVIGLVVKYLIDPTTADRRAGAAKRIQADWDEHARNSQVMDEKCQIQIRVMEEAIDNKFLQASAANREVDEQILIAVKDLQNSVGEIREELKANRDESRILKSGVLDLHLYNLIATCKVYIERGYVTPIELMQYNERMTLYHNLGGNGHMDIWDQKVRELPVREHNE